MHRPESFHIVVTDINHHVRSFLQRELEKEGYAVSGLKTGSLAYQRIFNSAPLDLIIVDPQVFNSFDQALIEKIFSWRPVLQLIIHTYTDSIGDIQGSRNIHFVEKSGQSIYPLKRIIGCCFEYFKATTSAP